MCLRSRGPATRRTQERNGRRSDHGPPAVPVGRGSGHVHAPARGQTIRADGANKSTAEIEAEVRQKLADAGLPNARVSVTKTTLEGKPGKMVTIEVGK
jgi:hypothetical protein